MADFYKERRQIEREMEESVISSQLTINFSAGSYYDVGYKKPVSNTLAKIWFAVDFFAKTQQIVTFQTIVDDVNYINNLAIAMDMTVEEVQTIIDGIVDDKATDVGIERDPGAKAKFNVYLTRDVLDPDQSYAFNSGEAVWTRPLAGVTYRYLATDSVIMLGSEDAFYEALADNIQDSLDYVGTTDKYVIRMEVEAELSGVNYNVGSYAIENHGSSDFNSVFNIDGPFQEGEDEENNYDLLERVKNRQSTSRAGSEPGYKSVLYGVSGVDDVNIQGFRDPLMVRDVFAGKHLGAKSDIYVLGTIIKSYLESCQVSKQSFIGSTPDDIVLNNQPVESIISVIGESSGELQEGESWVLYKDFDDDTKSSVFALDRIKFINSVIDFIEVLITRADQIGVDDAVPLGVLVEMTRLYDHPEVLAATPFLVDGTFIIGCSPYPYYASSPLACTPEFVDVTRVENVTKGVTYDLTDISYDVNQIILASTPNVGFAAPEPGDLVYIDYLWKHCFLESWWQILFGLIDWTPGDVFGYGPDEFGARSSPALSADYYADYKGEAPIFDEVLSVNYRVNDLIKQCQDEIDDVRSVCDDVQARESKKVLVDMEMDVVSDGTYEDEELPIVVATAVTSYMTRFKLGEGVDQSDVIGVVSAIKPDFYKTILTQDLSALADSILVESTVDFPESGIIYIDQEAIKYEKRKPFSFYSLTRGVSGTVAKDHLAGALVTSYQGQLTQSSLGVSKISKLPFTMYKRDYVAELVIDSEKIVAGYIENNYIYGALRGYSETSPAAHSSGASVYLKTKVAQDVVTEIEVASILVNSTVGFPDSGVINIGAEKIYYTWRDNSHYYDLTRGYGGTTIEEHAQEDEVYVEGELAGDISDSDTAIPLVDSSIFKEGISFTSLDVSSDEYLRAGNIVVNVVEV